MPLVDLNGLAHFKDKENAMMAADYSASSTYAVGDYVYYNGTLYRCTTAITTAEAWTSGHWTAAALGDDVTSLKNAITELEDVVIVSPTEPTSESNKIWVNNTAQSVQIPTMDDLAAILPEKTITDQAIAIFDDGASNIPISNLVVDLDYSADGYTGASITRTGLNLFDKSKAVTGSINSTGGDTTGPDKKRSEYIPVKPDTFYYFSNLVNANSGRSGFWYDKTKTGLSVIYLGSASAKSGKVQSPANAAFMRICAMATEVNTSQVEVGESASTYAAFDGQTLNFDWATDVGVIYGGTLNVLTGELISTFASDGTTLETPVAYQLQGKNMTTAYGVNNILSNTGNVNTLVYRADLVKYINSL